MSVKKIIKRLKKNLIIYNYTWLARTSAYHARDDYTEADPLKIIFFDPNEIKYFQLPVKDTIGDKNIYTDMRGRLDKYKNIGRVYDGDWDTKKVLIEDQCDIYRLLFDRYKKNMEWSESEIYKKFAAGIHQEKVVWHGCATIDDLKKRVSQVDNLYKNIAENGYVLNYLTKDKGDTQLVCQLRKIDLVSRLNEVTVNIDRDGNFIHNSSGTHRKIIAKLLGIKKIPVRILARHKKWQEIRNAILMAKQDEECNKNVRSHLGNPDLEDIIPENWNNKPLPS
jgi:hypothetical protein